MSNPYSPPQAPVSDIEVRSTDKCAHVELACKLMWASFGFSVLDSAWSLTTQEPEYGYVIEIIGETFGLGVGFLLTWWITSRWRKGRNWMRWLYTILNVAGYLAIPVFWDFFRSALTPLLTRDPVVSASLIIQWGMGFAVLVLLHTGETRGWFAAHKK